MSEKKKSGTGRTRNFATVLYPESAKENWLSILEELKIPAFVSPLHKDDVNANGEKKKEHYHIILMFDGVKTEEQVKIIFELIGGVGCEKVNSIRGYARYLCHLDNPEKASYNKSDVISLNGADYLSVISLPTDRYGTIKEMIQFCKDNDVFSYSDLLEYAMENKEDWFASLCDNSTLVMKEYLKSKSWTKTKTRTIIVNGETGEIEKET